MIDSQTSSSLGEVASVVRDLGSFGVLLVLIWVAARKVPQWFEQAEKRATAALDAMKAEMHAERESCDERFNRVCAEIEKNRNEHAATQQMLIAALTSGIQVKKP